MTTPAQIEAARSAISKILFEIGIDSEAMAKAALRATAQVGEPRKDEWYHAIDPDQKEPDLDDYTIERCAQVAETLEFPCQTIIATGENIMRKANSGEIAAAIRKLKDE